MFPKNPTVGEPVSPSNRQAEGPDGFKITGCGQRQQGEWGRELGRGDGRERRRREGEEREKEEEERKGAEGERERVKKGRKGGRGPQSKRDARNVKSAQRK